MINVYVHGIDCPDHNVKDVEAAFSAILLDGSEMDRKLIQRIEEGSYLSPTHLLDRFGVTLPVYDLSTSCKAALLAYHRPDAVINCIEVGFNGVSAILNYCDGANIVLHNNQTVVSPEGDSNIPDKYRGYTFNNSTEFAFYLSYGWPQIPTTEMMEDIYADFL